MNKKTIKDFYSDFLAKKDTPSALLERVSAKIDGNQHNAYITMTLDLAKIQAKQSDERFQQGKPLSVLDGIPYSLKDLFITKNIKTTAGSLHLSQYVPPYQGAVAQFLQEAGAVLVGKVGCDEFGMGGANENTPYGAILNPRDPSTVAGGSSGGSAAAVAEGSCIFSIGTDTGGSIRLPANFCGLMGFKPSYGRVSRHGQIAYASSLDQAGPMANCIDDLKVISSFISRQDHKDPTQLPQSQISYDRIQKFEQEFTGKKIRIGLDQSLIDGCEKEVQSELHCLIEELNESDEYEIVPISLKHLRYGVSVYYLIAPAEASSNLARYDGIHYGLRAESENDLIGLYTKTRSLTLGEEVKKRIILGTFALSAGYSDQFYHKACAVRELITQDFDKALSLCDVIFSPVCATKAFKLNSQKASKDCMKTYLNDLYTIPVNLAGLPAVSLPAPDCSGLPTGFQLIGNYYGDEKLLGVAAKVAAFFKIG